MYLKKYNKLITSGSWSAKDPKYVKNLALVGVPQKRLYKYKKSPEKSNRSNKESTSSTKGEPSYIKDVPL